MIGKRARTWEAMSAARGDSGSVFSLFERFTMAARSRRLREKGSTDPSLDLLEHGARPLLVLGRRARDRDDAVALVFHRIVRDSEVEARREHEPLLDLVTPLELGELDVAFLDLDAAHARAPREDA